MHVAGLLFAYLNHRLDISSCNCLFADPNRCAGHYKGGLDKNFLPHTPGDQGVLDFTSDQLKPIVNEWEHGCPLGNVKSLNGGPWVNQSQYIFLKKGAGRGAGGADRHSAFGHSATGQPAFRTSSFMGHPAFWTSSYPDVQLLGHPAFGTSSYLDVQLLGQPALWDI